jgi:hypothetical protein
MKESVALRKRFCKDFNLPIDLFDSPYFEQRLAILDEQFNSVELYEDFMEEVNTFDNEEEYFAYYNKVKDDVINYIHTNSEYEAFNSRIVPDIYAFPRKELYSDCNDGKTFFSIDMRRANFSTLSKLFPGLVNNQNSWEVFLGMFTNLSHIQKSKYIRQVILGACNPRRQTDWERFLMVKIALSIQDELNLCHIISVSTDEILIESDSPDSMAVAELDRLIYMNCSPMFDLVKTTKFVLKKIDGFGWVKQFIQVESTDEVSDKYEFKCVSSDKFHILTKLYRGEELTDDDLVFRHNGVLAKYLTKECFKLDGSFRD